MVCCSMDNPSGRPSGSANYGNLAILGEAGKLAIIQRIARGLRLTDIIAELNLQVSPQSISKALTGDPDYAAAIHAGTIARLDGAERAIQDAREQVDVSRAGAYHKAIAWRAEREVPDRYGLKSSTINVTIVHADAQLGAEAAGLLDALRVIGSGSTAPTSD